MNIKHNRGAQFRRTFIVFFSILSCLCVTFNALAEPAPAPTPVDYTEYDATHPERDDKIRIGLYYPLGNGDQATIDTLYQIRQTLSSVGYYGNTEPNYGSNMLDQSDLNAISVCWRTKTGTNYPTNLGLTYAAMDLILQGPDPTEAPHEYADIRWHEGSPELPAVLERLNRLGYLQDRAHDVYDEAVRDAMREFGRNNGFPSHYDEDPEAPITVQLQQMLLEKDEKELDPMPTATEPPKVPYFERTVTVAGLHLPMLAVWGIGLVVLIAGVLLIVYLFMPSEKKAENRTKNTVHFRITYGGKTQQTNIEIEKALKIGRGIGDFPLNLEDAKISRRHCELYYLNDTLMLRDYSSNGTKINGKLIHDAECMLANGDVIEIGDHTIVISL